MIEVDEGLIYFECRECGCQQATMVDESTDGIDHYFCLECDECGKTEGIYD
jgi:uncharacterized Zn finger protein